MLARVVKRIEGTSDTWQLLRRDLFGEPYYYRLLSDCVLDVGHKSAQSALHAIVRVSSAGVASRSERCAASFVMGAASRRMRFTRKSSVERIDIVDISKEVFSSGRFLCRNQLLQSAA